MTERTLALCIPAYNAAAFLPRLLGSAQRQRIPFDEILVYDDCSTDNTADVARSFGATVISGDVNRGCSAGKNRLLAETRCGWVHFHDADDDLLEGFTVLAHRWMSPERGPDVVLFNYESRDFATDRYLALRSFDAAKLHRNPVAFAIRTQINPYCGLYRASKIRDAGGYDEDPLVLFNEDCRFHMRLAFHGLSFAIEEQVAIVNLERPSSMSMSNRARCAQARLHVLLKAANEAPAGVEDEIAREAWLAARQLGYHALFDDMRECIRLALSLGLSCPVEERSRLVRGLARIAPDATFRARARFVQWRARLKKAPIS